MPSCKVDEATKKKILAAYRKGKSPTELAGQYGISVNTVKSWIKRDKATWPDPKKGAAEHTRKRPPGAPKGSQNAKGHGAPLGNQNAVTHGGYRNIWTDVVSQEELALVEELDYDSERLLLDEIALLTIRERRLMQTIAKYKDDKKGLAVAGITKVERKRTFDNADDEELYRSRIAEKVARGERLPGTESEQRTEIVNVEDLIHRAEDALTRCQAQKQRCIQSLISLREKRGDSMRSVDSNLLEAIVYSSSEEVDLSDIPEIQQKAKSGHDMVEQTNADEL